MIANTDSPLKSLLQQIGGETQFDFLIQAYCENIEEDEAFDRTLKGIDTERFVELMSNLLHMSFAYCSETSLEDEDVRSRIIIKNYTLFEVGLDSIQLKKLQDHFQDALHDSWVEGEVFEQCAERFGALRAVFEEESINMPTASVNGLDHKEVSARSA